MAQRFTRALPKQWTRQVSISYTPPVPLWAFSGEQFQSLAVLAALQPGDVVMIKGSLGSRMGPLVEAIKSKWPPVVKDT